MRMREPPGRPPRRPRRPAQRADAYLFAPAIALLVAAILFVAHTLLVRH